MARKSPWPARVAACALWTLAPGLACAAPLEAPQPAQPGNAHTGSAMTETTAHDSGPGSTPLQAVPLKAVKVVGKLAPQGYDPTLTHTATRTDTLVLNVPQSIQVIPRQLLIDQGARSLEAAIRNAPGVSVQQGEGNRDAFYIRGVATKSDFFVDGLRDDTEYYRPLYNVAHVDVLQGPAAILFGRGGAGGVINLVTKKPERTPVHHVAVHLGSWQQRRGTLDLGGPLGATGAYRVMALAEHSGGFRDHYFLHRYAINPEFRFQLGADTRLDVGASLLDDRRLADRGIPSHAGRPARVSRDAFFGAPAQNVAHSRVSRFTLRLQHRFSDQLTLRNAFLVTENQRMYQNVYPGSAVDDQGMLKLAAYHHPTDRLSYLDRVELVSQFATGPVAHTLLIGTSFGWQRGNDTEWLPGESKTLPGLWPVSDPTIDPVTFDHLDRRNHVVGRELGVYAEDQAAFGEHWMALVGLRWDRFSVSAHYLKPGTVPDATHHVDTDFAPRVGLIYKPVENDSLYASVTRTFTPEGANIALSQKSPATAQLAPEQAVNYEIGNKLDLANDKLSITAAVFQLDLTDVVSKAADGSGRLVNTGEQRSRGVELAVTGTLTRHLAVYANYTHLDAKVTRATEDAAAGARVGLVPRNQFSIWTRYTFNPHWGLGAGVRGASRKYTSYDDQVALPGFAEADLMAYYQNRRYRVQLNLDNVTDRTYYATASGDNQIMPGAPRHASLSLSMSF